MFDNFDFSNFWDDGNTFIHKIPSDELILSVEEELGYKLPESYIWLMKRHNGGTPKNTCFRTSTPTSWADDHIAISNFLSIGRDDSNSLCGEFGSKFWINEWEFPDIGVAICNCQSAGHDMVFLDYTNCIKNNEPSVVHIDQENDYQITHLADTFKEFVRGLVNEFFI